MNSTRLSADASCKGNDHQISEEYWEKLVLSDVPVPVIVIDVSDDEDEQKLSTCTPIGWMCCAGYFGKPANGTIKDALKIEEFSNEKPIVISESLEPSHGSVSTSIGTDICCSRTEKKNEQPKSRKRGKTHPAALGISLVPFQAKINQSNELGKLWVKKDVLFLKQPSAPFSSIQLSSVIQVLRCTEKGRLTLFYRKDNSLIRSIDLEFEKADEMEDIFRSIKRVLKKRGFSFVVAKPV